MVAKEGPDSSSTPDNSTSAPARTPDSNPDSNPEGSLTQKDLYQLTLFKWRYFLENNGFEPWQVRELMFLKWLHTSRRVLP